MTDTPEPSGGRSDEYAIRADERLLVAQTLRENASALVPFAKDKEALLDLICLMLELWVQS